MNKTSCGKPSPLLLSYPYARIEVEGKVWCRVGERFPAHPSIGSQVLIFVCPQRFNHAGDTVILTPEDGQIFFETTEKHLSAPSAFDDPMFDESEPLTLEEIVVRSKDLLAEAQGS